MEIIYQDEFVEMRKNNADHCIEYVRVKSTPDDETDKEILNKLAFQVKDKVFCKVIFDVSKINFLRNVTREYLKNFYLPFLFSLGLNVFAVVTGENMLNKVYYQKLFTEISEMKNNRNIQTGFFININKAREWINDK